MEGGAALRRVGVVVPKHSAEPFPALYFAGSPADLIIRVDHSILQSLMAPFMTVMNGEVFQDTLVAIGIEPLQLPFGEFAFE